MSEFVLEEKGFFWWGDEHVPPKHWAPNSAVTGLLRISKDGQTTLQLDSVLPEPGGPMAGALPPDPDPAERKTIAGILRSDKHVLLNKLRRHGGRWSSGGISYGGFLALECLVGARRLSGGMDTLKARSLSIDISEYADWMQRKSVGVKKLRTGLQATYRRPPTQHFKLGRERLSISSTAYAQWRPGGTVRVAKATLREEIRLSLTTTGGMSITSAREKSGLLQDFMILLTDSEHVLAWPDLQIGKVFYAYYCYRVYTDVEAPVLPRAWLAYRSVEADIGALFQAWCEKREHFGSGFYQYFGNRRGMKVVAEFRLASLIWGLESFHRTKNPRIEKDAPLQQKIDRILAQVTRSSDRNWLKGRLKHAHEPSLETRLAELIGGLPIGLERDRVRAFAMQCANLRNDLSHFGGTRDTQGDYAAFVSKVRDAHTALMPLYHALILREIGVRDELISEQFKHSYVIRFALVRVGLLDQSALK